MYSNKHQQFPSQTHALCGVIESVTLAIMAVPTSKTIINDADAKQVHQVATSVSSGDVAAVDTRNSDERALHTNII